MPSVRGRFSVRGIAIGGALAVVVLTGIACLFSAYVDTPYVTYAFQVLSGNWGGSKPAGVDENSYIVGAVAAVILNTLTITAIVKGAIELTLIRKDRSMNIKNAFNVRDQLAFKSILAELAPVTAAMPEAKVTEMEGKLWQCFIAADEKWEKEFIPAMMPGAKGAEFLDKIHSGPN